jgi:alkylhydroperoxidase family enzyme
MSHDAAKAMFDLQAHVNNSGLESSLVNLVYLLVSRINGCAY